MPFLYPGSKILLFSNPAIAGKCKTRLIPALGKKGAARLQQNLLDKIIKDIAGYQLCPFELWQSEPTGYFSERYSHIKIKTQTGDNLGKRMENAISESLAAAQNVIVIGSDCVLYTRQYLETAIELLETNNIVLGPANDGGYVLLGTNKNIPTIFQDISWGTPQVLLQTINKLSKEAVKFKLLDELWDIDTGEDLLKLQKTAPEILNFLEK